ncbi:putative 40S ribosomal protein S12 [Trypanosoma cruzi]|uniref:40S ribosomal protein S12 n=2 Tax=Trypanosoma cruzi TaxID=5693 RepID=Q4DW69_TRYCC|nr:40S ribosomal protein S12, putative [Trypanosoma cruzi]EAN96753.1 40S ribosomal protein S12, putative [Trypanosoma cruzi]PWV08362.1 putative 40S ribosomal protein S12 [Trypanosoma cruzi]RNC41244.1 40S ribosomal protein S12 [Trypanosoma cruzi]|eukprot:XP_818604.1 40S ribosomal protein S12 [Trypanosoma cruzi strain CL Brener]
MADETRVEKHDEEPTVTQQFDVEPENLRDAIRIVVRKSLEVNGLVRGLSEVARALDRRTAHMCLLAADCEDEEYKKLIKALASQANIDFVEVESREELAEWAGLQKQKSDGSVKTFKCSCVAIRDFGERTRALNMLLGQLAG